jgi:hypothetical protein
MPNSKKIIMKLAEAMNTYNPALFIIKNKGFDIKIRLNENQDEIERWIAKKKDLEVIGFNPLSLLGLVIIAEQLGENWRQTDTGNLYDEILEQDF